ncbi:MAG TPA: hypothetical protein VGM76_11850 [Lacipirellulaceae bacterium]
MLHHIVMIERREAQILEIVAAPAAASGLTGRLNRRQQQRD